MSNEIDMLYTHKYQSQFSVGFSCSGLLYVEVIMKQVNRYPGDLPLTHLGWSGRN